MTHLIARLRARTGSGIDRIDLAFASHFCGDAARGDAARYGAKGPRLFDASWANRFTRAAQRVWTNEATDRAAPLWPWLEAEAGRSSPRFTTPSRLDTNAWRRRLLSWAGHVVGRPRVPGRAIYLNVGYHRFEEPRFFNWLAERPDVDAVFMIHDLLPLDYPEYFAPGEREKFDKRISVALRYGRAFLVSTEAVRDRLAAEIAARGLVARPMLVQPFPSPLAEFKPSRPAPATPYFVVVGTIEPRKNHLMLLNVWRELVRRAENPPRLVVVGVRGWENEQVVDMLDRCATIKPYVAEISDLGSHDLAELIAGARALLAPSFAEGYGLPIIEALGLGAPVVASDTPAAREVAQGRARLLSPIDGEGWLSEIERLSGDLDYFAKRKMLAEGFLAPDWPHYFASLDQFLEGLSAEALA